MSPAHLLKRVHIITDVREENSDDWVEDAEKPSPIQDADLGWRRLDRRKSKDVSQDPEELDESVQGNELKEVSKVLSLFRPTARETQVNPGTSDVTSERTCGTATAR